MACLSTVITTVIIGLLSTDYCRIWYAENISLINQGTQKNLATEGIELLIYMNNNCLIRVFNVCMHFQIEIFFF